QRDNEQSTAYREARASGHFYPPARVGGDATPLPPCSQRHKRQRPELLLHSGATAIRHALGGRGVETGGVRAFELAARVTLVRVSRSFRVTTVRPRLAVLDLRRVMKRENTR